jgi:hypothetical protein
MKNIHEIDETRNIVEDFLRIKGMPSMTTAQRDALSADNGVIIYNTTTNKFQGKENGSWVDLI